MGEGFACALLDGGEVWREGDGYRLVQLGMGMIGAGKKGVSGRWMPCCARDPRNRIVGASRVRIPYFLFLRHFQFFFFFVLPDSAVSVCLVAARRWAGRGAGWAWMFFWGAWLCVWRR